jgi:hypothetical protein
MSYISFLNDKYRTFNDELTNIEDNKYVNNMPNIGLLDNLYVLYNNVSEHLVKMSTTDTMYDASSIKNIIPPNPYITTFTEDDKTYLNCDRLAISPLPFTFTLVSGSPPKYKVTYNSFDNYYITNASPQFSEITMQDQTLINTNFMSYYNKPNSSENSILHRIANLFTFYFDNNNLHLIEKYFARKLSELEINIKQQNKIVNSINELIVFYKEVCRYIVKLKGEYESSNYEENGVLKQPGPKFDLTIKDMPLKSVFEQTNINDGDICEAGGDFYLVDFLCHPFFNKQSGGENISGILLQSFITAHFCYIQQNIIKPFENLMLYYQNLYTHEQNRLIPLNDGSAYINNPNLFGNKNEIEQLLALIKNEIDTTEKFYQEINNSIAITTPLSANTLQNWKVSSITIDQIKQKYIIAHVDTTNIDDIINNYYDQLSQMQIDITAYIEELQQLIDQVNTKYTDKNNQTNTTTNGLNNLLEEYRKSINDITINTTSNLVDGSLLNAYDTYLNDLKDKRGLILAALDNIFTLINECDDIQNTFNTIYNSSGYYKLLILSRWFVVDNNNNKLIKL